MKKTMQFIAVLFYLIFAFSGLIKWIPSPVDPLIIFASLLLVISVFNLNKFSLSRQTMALLGWFLLFFLWMYFTNFYTASPAFWKEKTIASIPSILTFVFPLIIFNEEDYFPFFTKAFNILLIIGFIILTYLFFTGKFELLIARTEGSKVPNYLKVAGYLAVGFFMNINNNKMMGIVMKIAAIIFMLMLGARGPLIFMVILLLYYYFGQRRYKLFTPKNLFFMIVLVVLAALSYIFLYDILERTLMRFSGFNEGDKSTLERVNDLFQSYEVISNNLIFGVGNGGYGQVAAGLDELYYPHNLFLEIWSELGLIGLLIFIFTLIKQWKIMSYVRKLPYGRELFLAFMFTLLEFMVSGSVSDFRVLFVWMGTMTAYYNVRAKQPART